MKKAVTLCGVMACLCISLMLFPAAVAAAGSVDRRFLRATAVRSSRQSMHLEGTPHLHGAKEFDDILKHAHKEAPITETTTTQATIVAPAPVPMPAPAPMPMPALAPMPMPAPEVRPAPAAAPAPALPPPPCNWTLDAEKVARPVVCIEMSDGNTTCEQRANLSFASVAHQPLAAPPFAEGATCIPPTVLSCDNPARAGRIQLPMDGPMSLYSVVGIEEDAIEHGREFDIVCSEDATAIDQRYPLESWAQDWYPGVQKASVVCNNGTIIRMQSHNSTCLPGFPCYKPESITPKELKCALKQKVSLTQDDISYLRWTEPLVEEAEKKGYKWIDMDAILHKKLLKDAMNESAHVEIAARQHAELAEIPVLKKVIKALIDNRLMPRGEVLNDGTCKDMEKHWLYQLENGDTFKKAGNIGYANYVPPPNATLGYPTSGQVPLEKAVGLTCSYTMQKSAVGYDPYTGKMNYHYRDGCFCESRWTGGCPFRAELQPTFKSFGFDSIETKHVSNEVGAGTNALCWYFSKPQNPEWGYLRNDEGYMYQAPIKNVTEMKRDWLSMRKLAQDAHFSTH